MKGAVTMPDMQSNLHERLNSWRKVADEAKAEATRQQRPATQEDEAYVLDLAMLVIWLAGLGSCFILAWWLSAGSFLLTGLTMLLPVGAWLIFGWYRWALLLPLSLMGWLALNGALLLW
jgi:hypothetical protein